MRLSAAILCLGLGLGLPTGPLLAAEPTKVTRGASACCRASHTNGPKLSVSPGLQAVIPREIVQGGRGTTHRVLVPPPYVPGFEAAFGSDAGWERAGKGATPAAVCPDGGYLSVGSSLSDAEDGSDVYLVRVAEDGTAMWERTYDLGGPEYGFSDDVGTSLREVRFDAVAGFIVTGTTRQPDRFARDVFLLRLDCNGEALWARRYQTLLDLQGDFTDDAAGDVIEAASGIFQPSNEPGRGDFIVAGSSRHQVDSVGDLDAYLLRTDSLGGVRWSRLYYDAAGAGKGYAEWFNALTEALPVEGPTGLQDVGDLIAVGAHAGGWADWQDGLAVRVSGLDGSFSEPQHALASHNLPTSGPVPRVAELWAVRELVLAGPKRLSLAMVGTGAAAQKPTDGYALLTGADPRVVIVERLIGDRDGAGFEGFTDLQEIAAPAWYGGVGNLAVSGYAAADKSVDAALLALDVQSLVPVTGSGRRFGDHGAGLEVATSLSQVFAAPADNRGDGFYLHGFTASDPAAVGDPEDFFTIKSDLYGVTGCYASWAPDEDTKDDCSCNPEPESADPFTVDEEAEVTAGDRDWPYGICGV